VGFGRIEYFVRLSHGVSLVSVDLVVGIERLIVVAIDAGIDGSSKCGAGCDEDRGDEIFLHGRVSVKFRVREYLNRCDSIPINI